MQSSGYLKNIKDVLFHSWKVKLPAKWVCVIFPWIPLVGLFHLKNRWRRCLIPVFLYTVGRAEFYRRCSNQNFRWDNPTTILSNGIALEWHWSRVRIERHSWILFLTLRILLLFLSYGSPECALHNFFLLKFGKWKQTNKQTRIEIDEKAPSSILIHCHWPKSMKICSKKPKFPKILPTSMNSFLTFHLLLYITIYMLSMQHMGHLPQKFSLSLYCPNAS